MSNRITDVYTHMSASSIAASSIAATATPPAGEDWEKYLVSPDLLLSFCEVRMNSINSSVKSAMKAQQVKENQQKALNDFEGVIKGFCPNGPTNEQDWAKVQAAYATMQGTLGKDDPICQQCGQVMSDLDKALHPGDPPNVASAAAKLTALQSISPEAYGGPILYKAALDAAQKELDQAKANPDKVHLLPLADKAWTPQAAERVQGVLDDVKAGTELDMIQLQSLVSQRQTVIQLVTGMMNKIDETQAIAARAVGGG